MLIFTDGEFYNAPDVEFETVLSARADRIAKVARVAAYLRDQAADGAAAFEMSTWADKLAQARAGAGPDLEAEAAAREITVAELAAKIIAKSQRSNALEARIAGIAGRHRDRLDALNRIDRIVDYDFSRGWPRGL